MVAVDEEGKKLEDDEIVDVLIGTLFGAHDTTATTLTWIMKFLTENPDILAAVTVGAFCWQLTFDLSFSDSFQLSLSVLWESSSASCLQKRGYNIK